MARDLGLHAAACLARLFGKAGGENDGGFDAGAAAAFEFGRDEFGRDDEDREIGRFRQIGDRSIGLEALHLRGAAADRIDLAGKGMAQNDFQNTAAQAAGIG